MEFIEFFMYAIKNLKIISIVGLAKNSGKTTILNHIIKHLENKIKLGITSIGRDGEPYDIITNLPKPLIFIKKGTIIATAKGTISASKIKVKTLKNTSYNTPLGNIKIFEAINDGFIELAGPSINTQVISICEELENFDCDLILIDGAFDRRSYATPQISEGVILSSGASVSENMETVIDETIHNINIMTLPKEKNTKIRELTKEGFQKAKVGFIDISENLSVLNIKSLLGYEKQILDKINKNIEYLIVKGAVTDKLLRLIIKEHRIIKNLKIIIEDATKLFVSNKTFSNFFKTGNKIKVLNKINLLALAINPTSPYGYEFNPSLFMQGIKKRTDIPVFDLGIE